MATNNMCAMVGSGLQKLVKKEKNQNIQVVVRCRPLNSTEKKQGAYSVVDVHQEKREVSIKERTMPAAPVRTFNFDRVFGIHSKQIEVYKTVVVPILEEVLLGYNCTIFAYGQTGTGKTFTMEGERSEDSNISWEDDPLSGIIPRAMNQLFSRLQKQGSEFTVRVSFLEIYNEELIDLLGAESVENPRLKIYEDTTKKGACIIQGLEEVVVNSRDQVYQILQLGAARRQTAATLMNAHSSRSHSLFMVTIHIKENSVDGEELLKTGKFNLVDLAGSECIGRSGAVDKRAREAGNINQSLLTLGRVITALVEHTPHVPYRESKLTRLLQDSLGGRTKTSIIATVSPASSNLEETLSTLDYAHRAKNITNKPEINQKLTKKALLKEYTEEIERMRKDLQAARDKNGIYLAEENYVAMQSRLVQQGDLIKELEEKIAAMTLQAIKLNELFTDTKQELEETAKDLEMTAETLKVTETKLNRTTRERDEQTQLVDEHVKSETRLFAQASKLLDTADESTKDVQGLHAKLDRKREVESKNTEIQEQFRSGINQSICTMADDLEVFAEQQSSMTASVHKNLGLILKTKSLEVATLSASMSRVIGVVNSGLNDMDRAHERHVHGMHKGLNKIVTKCEEVRDAEICRIFDFNQQVVIEEMNGILAALNLLTTDLETLRRTLFEQMNRQQQVTKEFVGSQLSCLADCRDLMNSFADQQVAEVESQVRHQQEFANTHSKLNKSLMSDLIEKVTKMIHEAGEQQETHVSTHVQQVTDKLTQLKDATHQYQNKSANILDKFVEMSEKGRDDLVTSSQSNNAQSEELIGNLLVSIGNGQEGIKRISASSDKFCTDSEEIWKNHTDFSVDMLKKHKDLVDTTLQTHADGSQALSVKTVATIRDLDAQQASEFAAFETRLGAEQTSIVQLDEQRKNWKQRAVSGLEYCVSAVDQFLTEELQKDVPTGTTPQRREFQYPRQLTKTGNHTQILEDFRTKYFADEAVNTALPYESEHEMSSEVRTSDDLSLPLQNILNFNPEVPVDGEEYHNNSDDSAISATSAISSNRDQQTIEIDNNDKENKQNKNTSKTRHGSKTKTSETPLSKTLAPSNKGSLQNLVGSTKKQGSL